MRLTIAIFVALFLLSCRKEVSETSLASIDSLYAHVTIDTVKHKRVVPKVFKEYQPSFKVEGTNIEEFSHQVKINSKETSIGEEKFVTLYSDSVTAEAYRTVPASIFRDKITEYIRLDLVDGEVHVSYQGYKTRKFVLCKTVKFFEEAPKFYVIQKGDNITKMSQKFGITKEEYKALYGTPKIGQKIHVKN